MRGETPSAHHSLAKQGGTFSRHSLADSAAPLAKKMSASSLSNFVDIDRLIDDIKLAPQRQPQVQQHLAIIKNSLAALREVSGIVDEVRTIELLLESIGKKLASEGLAGTRVRHAQSVAQDGSARRSALSPVKQFEEGSRIVYANFSLKDVAVQLETPIKRISLEREREESEQMDKLNSEIMVLEKMLRAKGVASEAKKVHGSVPQQAADGRGSSGKLKQNAPAPKKYSLMEKTQEITLARPKMIPYDRSRPRQDHNYR